MADKYKKNEGILWNVSLHLFFGMVLFFDVYESGTHGFNEKISRTYFGEIFNLTREEMRIWMNMILNQ